MTFGTDKLIGIFEVKQLRNHLLFVVAYLLLTESIKYDLQVLEGILLFG